MRMSSLGLLDRFARDGGSVQILTLGATLLLGSCANPPAAPETATLAAAQRQVQLAQKNSLVQADHSQLAEAHKANPADAAAALAYARALRLSGAKVEALAVLDKTAAAKPNERRLQLESGLLALELGQTSKAERLLRRAYDAKTPDWRLHSGLGAALAASGKQQEAQVQFAKALALAPDHPSVLNNLAMSYALDGKADEAEKLLRRAQRTAPDTAQVQQNLALVLGLQGNYEAARRTAQATLPPTQANQNLAYLQSLAGAKVATRTTDTGTSAGKTVNASLPQATYQLGGPAPKQ